MLEVGDIMYEGQTITDGNSIWKVKNISPASLNNESWEKLSDFALINHNHDGVYSPINHNHDSSYSTLSHNHDTSYAQLVHNHNELYSSINHNHDNDYLSSLGGVVNGDIYCRDIITHGKIEGRCSHTSGTKHYKIFTLDITDQRNYDMTILIEISVMNASSADSLYYNKSMVSIFNKNLYGWKNILTKNWTASSFPLAKISDYKWELYITLTNYAKLTYVIRCSTTDGIKYNLVYSNTVSQVSSLPTGNNVYYSSD